MSGGLFRLYDSACVKAAESQPVGRKYAETERERALAPELERGCSEKFVVEDYRNNGANIGGGQKSVGRLSPLLPHQDAIDRNYISKLHYPERKRQHINRR